MDWAVSLHPDWDRLYAAGWTAREITDITGAPGSTVRRHLQVRREYDGGLLAAHEAARAAAGPQWPTATWRARYAEVQAFVRTHGRFPASTGDEKPLAAWLAAQRAAHKTGTLPTAHTAALNAIPGWDVSPARAAADQRWQERLAQLHDYVAEHGHWPRWRHHETEHERILGVWLHTQHQWRTENRLLPWRLEALDTTVPGWHATM